MSIKCHSKRIVYIIIVQIFFFLANVIDSYAAEASVTFGSTAYEKSLNENFPIGVWIDSSENIGAYHVEVTYDSSILRYEWGGDSFEGNVITLEGTDDRDSIGYFLYFTAINSGNAELSLNNASAMTIATDEEEAVSFELSVMGPVVVTIPSTGEEVTPETVPEETIEPPEEQIEDEGAIEVDEEPLDDTNESEPEVEVGLDTVEPEEDLDAVPEEIVIRDIHDEVTLSIKGNAIVVINNETQTEYPAFNRGRDEEPLYSFSPYAMSNWPEGLTNEMVSRDGIFCYMDISGNVRFLKYDYAHGRGLVPWDSDVSGSKVSNVSPTEWVLIGVAVSGMLLALSIIMIGMYINKRQEAENESSVDKSDENPFEYEDI